MADEDDEILDPELEALQREAFEMADLSGAAAPPAEGDDPGGEPPEPAPPSEADQLLRLSADFANYRRRMERDRIHLEARGVEKAVLGLLPALDHLELALAHSTEGSVDQAFLDGLIMIRDQFLRSLAELGIERMEVVGLPFDPNEHEAVAIVPAPEHPEGTVVGLVRPGYRTGERLLRPPRVTVAAPPSQE
jgi:molecular chaperone GrpE